jgi:hypothetical protein
MFKTQCIFHWKCDGCKKETKVDMPLELSMPMSPDPRSWIPYGWIIEYPDDDDEYEIHLCQDCETIRNILY